jgi:superfamily I DNA/RNA helicase
MPDDVAAELKGAIDRILASKARKKLVVAGPGAGKTTLFRQLLDGTGGTVELRLVVTFINNLKTDLEGNLGDAARVFTLHGYCQHLLHRHGELRNGLSANLKCYPGLVSLIKMDWVWLQNSKAPEFVSLMRDFTSSPEQDAFYFSRANYYDAVDFDDSVYRTHERLVADTSLVPVYELVLIDEFQDFNKMEAAVIDLLAQKNSIVVAGDDDQALYSQLRGASWDHIRAHYKSGNYEIFELPFCMRCPEVIVGAVNDVLAKAQASKKLKGRIEKPYRYFEPVKGDDSRRYPKIELVETSVQRTNANYFGRYIGQCIKSIPEKEMQLAKEKNELIAIIIGSNPYRRQVEEHLVTVGLVTPSKKNEMSEREQALEILNQNPVSNLGWRIILDDGDENVARDTVRAAAQKGVPLADIIPAADRATVLKEAKDWAPSQEGMEDGKAEAARPLVKITSFEGAKGMSAQYVFLIGMQSGDIPRSSVCARRLVLVLSVRAASNTGADLTCSRSSRSLMRRAMSSSEPAASLACGRNVTLSNCPAPSACSISTPEASSLYATTTIPASAQRCRYQS